MKLPMPTRQQLLTLLKTLSYERRDIVLASGTPSTEYVDCKQTALHPTGSWCLGWQFYECLQAIEKALDRTVHAVGGMSIGADPLATATSIAALSQGRSLPAYLVRKEPKGHGTGEYLEGLKNISPGADVMLLEDVVTTGGSTLMAAERVQAAGLNPIGVVTIIDREVGGMKRLEDAGLHARAIFTLSELRNA